MVNSPTYNSATMKMLEKSKYKHLYVFKFEQYYDGRQNTCLDYKIGDISLISKYLMKGKFIVVHALDFSYKQIAGLSPEEAKRIIWCVWGHDLYFRQNINPIKRVVFNILSNIRWKILNTKVYNKYIENVNRFAGIFIGFAEDANYLKLKYGSQLKIFKAQYPIVAEKIDGSDFFEKNLFQVEKKIKVLLGHSAAKSLNHKKCLKKMKKFGAQIEIYIPMSYGDSIYGAKIKKYVEKNFENVYICDKFMQNEEYIRFLNSVDIAIFDMKYQSALGNIFILLCLGKKIYLNGNGIVYKGLTAEGVKVYKTSSIKKLKFREFIMNDESEFNIQYGKKRIDDEYLFVQWENSLEKIYNNFEIDLMR